MDITTRGMNLCPYKKAAPVPHRRRNRGRQARDYFFAVVFESSITEVATRLLPSDL